MILNRNGFTLIELIIVLSVICVLGIMSVPRFTDLINKSKENATKAELAVLRNAIETYYEKNAEVYPSDIRSVEFLGKYVEEIPVVKLGKHIKESSKVKVGGEIDSSGGWYYNPETGEVFVNFTGEDTKGQIISTW
ncbi:type II secretion system protein [bacterium]